MCIGGIAVGPHEHRRVGILDHRQPARSLEPHQLVDVETGSLADLRADR